MKTKSWPSLCASCIDSSATSRAALSSRRAPCRARRASWPRRPRAWPHRPPTFASARGRIRLRGSAHRSNPNKPISSKFFMNLSGLSKIGAHHFGVAHTGVRIDQLGARALEAGDIRRSAAQPRVVERVVDAGDVILERGDREDRYRRARCAAARRAAGADPAPPPLSPRVHATSARNARHWRSPARCTSAPAAPRASTSRRRARACRAACRSSMRVVVEPGRCRDRRSHRALRGAPPVPRRGCRYCPSKSLLIGTPSARRHRRVTTRPQPRVSARQLRLGKTHRAFEGPRDLLVRPAFDVVQPHHRARHRRQSRERPVEIDEIAVRPADSLGGKRCLRSTIRARPARDARASGTT